jgi:hypothetical protein
MSSSTTVVAATVDYGSTHQRASHRCLVTLWYLPPVFFWQHLLGGHCGKRYHYK